MTTPPITAMLDWFGCATFRLTTAEGLTVFLDAYLDRVPAAPQSGVGVDDVEQADWILVGHSHFDHLWGAERIAARTGATVVGSYESVRILAGLGIPEEQLVAVSGGEVVRLDEHTTARVLPSQHSAIWASTPMPPPDEVCLGDLDLTWQDRQGRLTALFAALGGIDDESSPVAPLAPDVAAHLRAGDQGDRGDGGALAYVVETSRGSVLFQDSAGCWSPLLARERPDVAILAAAGRGVRDGQPVQGSLADFVAEEVAALGAPTVIPCHHDDWLPGFSHAVDLAPIREAVARAAPSARFVELGYATS